MDPFRFLHTADLHLGSPFRGLGERAPQNWLSRLQSASFQVFARTVEIAIEQRVQFVTVAGDLFDVEKAPMSVQFELRRGFERLQEAAIAVFVCHGNHDPLTGPNVLQWPGNVHVFPPVPAVISEGYTVPSTMFEVGGGTRVQISGFSYREAELYESLAPFFVRDERADFALALYHGMVGSSDAHQNYAQTDVEALVRQGFDFWGLGHIHLPQVIRASRPTIVYPGNPQGRHIREAGARGVVLADVSSSGDITLQRVPTAEVIWQECLVDLEGVENVALVRQRILERLKSLSDTAGANGLVARIVLTGQTPVHALLVEAGPDFADAIQADLDYLRMPVLLEQVELHTRPAVDVDALLQSQAFAGELLRMVASFQADTAAARQLLAALLADVFHPRNGLSVDALGDGDVEDLFGQVQTLLLQQLDGREVAQ